MKWTLSLLFISITMFSFAQNLVDVARIEIDRSEFDFGELLQGEKKSHVFSVKNTGNVPLIITDVHTQCGCTAVSFPENPIMPGDLAELVIQYDSTGKLGIQRKVVTIISNAPEEVKIRILAQVYL